MKINERGRGKFKPAPNYKLEEVQQLLLEKIEEEKAYKVEDFADFKEEEINYRDDKLNVISLFTGAGGLDLGFELAGLEEVIGETAAQNIFNDKEEYEKVRSESIFHSVFANDIFPEALQTYSKNMSEDVFVLQKDITKIKDFPKRANVVLGGFPCPGFSEAGPRLIDDPRNFLYIHFIRCLIQVQPEIFVAENVKGMMTLGKGEVFNQIVEDFAAAGYRVEARLLNSRDYGVPQIRERVFLVGVREDIDFQYDFPDETHGQGTDLKPFVTLEEAIGDLEEDPGEYFTGSFSTIFMSRNRKKRWDEQSFTIQASGRQAPIHPSGEAMKKLGKDRWIFQDGEENNRRLSVKEISRIQTFPDWYEFSRGQTNISQNGQLNKIYKQIGNAVPVFLARAVAKPLSKWAIDYIEKSSNKTTTS